MNSLSERPTAELQAPPNECAIELASKAMGKTVAELLDMTVEPVADVLPDTKFTVKCGVPECEVSTIVTVIGDGDKIFGTADLYTPQGLACKK